MEKRFLMILAGLIFFSAAKAETDVLLLKVDYTTNRFEGGQKLRFTQSPETFTLRTEYKSPGDFGRIKVYISEIKAGIYLYSLIADGQEVDTKRMILTK